MKILLCTLIGYLLGSLNPAALFSKLKKKNLREQGTGNLGATNAMLVLGKGYGAIVMLFDIAKAFAAVKLAQILVPELAVAGLIAGGAAVIGHIYPFYLMFKGGKGLAAFWGLILGTDPFLFLILLAVALILVFTVNYSVTMPMPAAALFPVLYGFRTGDAVAVIIAVAVSVLIIYKHFSNIGKARRGEDAQIREYVKEHLFH